MSLLKTIFFLMELSTIRGLKFLPIINQWGLMKFSEEAFIHLNLLPLISIIVILQALCIYLIKQTNDKRELQHLCYKKSLSTQGIIGNFYNYLEDSYNPRAKALNKTLLHLNRSIQMAHNIYAQAALRAARETLYVKQRSIHSRLQTKWQTSLKKRKTESKTLRKNLSSYKFVSDLQYKIETPSILKLPQNPLAIGYSPEYEIKNTSDTNFKIKLDYKKALHFLQRILDTDRRAIQLDQTLECKTEIIKWRTQWIAKIK